MMTRRDKKHETEKVLDVDASMQGTLIFKDYVNLKINGTFEGVLNTKGSLMIGEHAVVNADITGESIVVAGNVIGNIIALKDLKLISPARVVGDIRTPLLSIAEGAIFDGTSRMLNKGRDFTDNAMTPDDLAKYLEIETNLVHEWANSGRLPGVKDGSVWKFERAKIDEWVAQGKIR
ncbi:MAG: polymer-forming cytoskeletal protein [Candidatus Omnitrophota bacterium]|nr:polymer-forming cytoskeletal protein [Candidatus Omnitrophota bacterium]